MCELNVGDSDDLHQKYSIKELFNILADALYYANKYIKSLHIRNLRLDKIESTTAAKHVFKGLTSLTIELVLDNHNDLLLENATRYNALSELLQVSQPTLESLTIRFEAAFRGVHSLGKFLHDSNNQPLTFPRLHSLSIFSLITSADFLSTFITAQPELRHITLHNISLGTTTGEQWPTLLNSFPTSVRSMYVRELRHRPMLGFVEPIGYNWIEEWRATDLQLVDGWELKYEGRGFLVKRLVEGALGPFAVEPQPRDWWGKP